MGDKIKSISKCSVYISAAALGILFLLIVLDFFLRNVFLVFIPGVFGFTQILLSICVFMALAYAYEQKRHIVIEAIYKLFPKAGKRFIYILSLLIFLAAVIKLSWFTLQFAISQMISGASTMTLSIPLWPVSIIAMAGLMLLGLSVLCDLISAFKNREVH